MEQNRNRKDHSKKPVSKSSDEKPKHYIEVSDVATSNTSKSAVYDEKRTKTKQQEIKQYSPKEHN